MAVAVLFTASCAKEDISSSIGGGEVEVTFTANLQDLGSRAYGDGSQVNTLRYYVYDYSSNNELTALNGTASRKENGKFEFSLPLLKGMKYNIVFWADCGNGSIYSYNPTAKTISANYNGKLSNNESFDAFYKCVTEIDPTNTTTLEDKTNIVLTRPFAQLNILTKDYAAIENNGVELEKSKIVGVIPTTLNVLEGTIVNPTPTATVELGFNTLPTDENVTDGLTPLSMNYILAPATQKFVADITVSYEGTIPFPSATYTNIPLQRNYRTNIIGNLLTASTDFTVTIDAVFSQPDVTPVAVKDTAELQAALDSAKDGLVINLEPGVQYGVVYMGRPTKDNNTTMYCKTHDFTTTDAAAFKAHLNNGEYHYSPYYTTTLKNLTIKGAEGATIAGLVATSNYATNGYDYVLDAQSNYYCTLILENIVFSDVAFTGKLDINTSDADSVYDGITFDNCTFTTGGTAEANGAAIRYYNESNNGNVKNIVVNKCAFTNCRQGVYVHHVNGVTVTNSSFENTGHNAIALQGHHGYVNLKNVVITGNTFANIADRIIRFNNIGADSNITITNNVANNSGDDNKEVIKATSIERGITTNIHSNDWGTGTVVVNNELKDPTVVNSSDALKALLAQDIDYINITLEAGTYEGLSFTDPVNYKAKNVTIVGKDGVSIAGFAVNSWTATNNIEINGLTFKNVTFTSDLLLATKVMANVTVENCDFVNDACIHQNDKTEKLTNLVVKDCTFAGDKNGTTTAVMLEHTENVTISGCEFTNIDFNVLQGGVLTGNVLVDNNTVNGTGDRVFRFVNTSNVNITISNNTINSDGDDAGELAKATNLTDINLSNNTWNGKSDAEVADKLININNVKLISSVEDFVNLQDNAVVKLASDIEGNVTLPAGVTLKGNGKQINGTLVAGGDLTFEGHTKVTAFSASYYNRTITIGEGACLEVTGTGRVSLAYGNTFNITGNVDDAKTADKATIQPSLIIPAGISITGGNDATMNITNAYVKIGGTTSKPEAANGTFTINIENSIAEFTNQLTFAEPTNGMNPTFNLNVENSVLTTGTKLILAAPDCNMVVDNSKIELATYFRNSGKVELKNGSTLTGSTIQFGENGGHDGKTVVDNSIFTITATSTGNPYDGRGTGSITAKNGAEVSVEYYKAMTITADATSTLIGTKVQ